VMLHDRMVGELGHRGRTPHQIASRLGAAARDRALRPLEDADLPSPAATVSSEAIYRSLCAVPKGRFATQATKPDPAPHQLPTPETAWGALCPDRRPGWRSTTVPTMHAAARGKGTKMAHHATLTPATRSPVHLAHRH